MTRFGSQRHRKKKLHTVLATLSLGNLATNFVLICGSSTEESVTLTVKSPPVSHGSKAVQIPSHP